MISKKKIKELEDAGQDYFNDWKCWNEKDLNKLTTVEEKKEYFHKNGHFQSIAYDLVGGNESEADYAYEGICKAMKKYLNQ